MKLNTLTIQSKKTLDSLVRIPDMARMVVCSPHHST